MKVLWWVQGGVSRLTESLPTLPKIFRRLAMRHFHPLNGYPGLCLFLYIAASSTAWVSKANAISFDAATSDSRSRPASEVYANTAWLNRDALLGASNVKQEAIKDIRVSSILCPVETQSRSYPHQTSSPTPIKSYCQPQRQIDLRGILGTQNSTLPYLIAPRNGQVQGPTPTVEWNPVTGVRRYEIRVVRQRDRQMLWGSETQASRITLPAQVNLMPGELYQIVVEADNGTSSRMEPCNAELSFGVLPSDVALGLQQDLAKIRSISGKGVTPQKLALQEADALLNRNLKTDAFVLISQREKQSPSLQGQFLLGTLASSQGLNQQAQVFFRQAATLASRVRNPEAVHEASKREDLAGDSIEQARQGKCGTSSYAVPTRVTP
jgi:hypothetical protein